MTPNVQLEVERKYEVPAGAELDWSTLPVLTVEPEQVPRDLHAVYFDTPGNRLAAFGIVLRRRKGGPDAGWHLKYRDQMGKHELHVPMLKTSDRLPAQMKQYVAGLLAGQELEPLATVVNNRQVLNVQHPDFGHVAEICIDDVVATDERAGLKRSWSEYEVELVNGSGADGTAVFEELETALFAGGLKPSASAAKIARAMGADDDAAAVTVTDLNGDPVGGSKDESKADKKKSKQKADAKKKDESKKKGKSKGEDKGKFNDKGATPAQETPVDPAAVEPEQVAPESAEDQVWVLVNTSVAGLLYADFLLRIGDPEGVHAVRVATRRLIAVIEGVGQELAGESHPELSEQLAAFSDQLSAARDAEVVVELLPQRAALVGEQVSSAGLGQLNALAQSNRESTRAAAVRHLNSKAHMQLLADLATWAEGIELNPKAREISTKNLATRAVKRWSRAVAEADQTLPSSQDAAQETAAVTQEGPAGEDNQAEHPEIELPDAQIKISQAVDLVHAHRKALRNLRYGLDGLAVTTGLVPKKSWRGLLDNAGQIQAELSQMMDSAVMDDWFAFAARSLIRTGGDRYVVGLLHGHERARVQDYERRAPELIDRLLSETSPDA